MARSRHHYFTLRYIVSVTAVTNPEELRSGPSRGSARQKLFVEKAAWKRCTQTWRRRHRRRNRGNSLYMVLARDLSEATTNT